MKGNFRKRIQDFKKEYLELLDKYDLEIAGYVLGAAYSVSSEPWLYDTNSNNNCACLYEITSTGAKFDPEF